MASAKKTPDELQAAVAKLKSDLRRKTSDYTTRNCLEFILTVYVVGILPLGMHRFVALFSMPPDWYWVPAEGWLFVMVTCAAAFADTWRERRRDDGTLTLLVALFGIIGTIVAALAYGFLMLRPGKVEGIVTAVASPVWWVAGVVAVVYLVYRFPALRESASQEAERKVGPKAKSGGK
jgi:peptidoglycan/LPS O-acetylase OafA/YrhL